MKIYNLKSLKGALPANVVRVDRKTFWGNPCKTDGRTPCPVCGKKHRSKKPALVCYKKYLWANLIKTGTFFMKFKRTFIDNEVAGLACWCYPEPCHAEIIRDCINWWKSQTS